MAWVRLIQTGFEFRDINELDQYAGNGSANGTISTTGAEVYTGSASLDIGLGVRPRGKATTGTDKICLRCGCFFRHAGTNANDEGIIFQVDGSVQILVTYDDSDSLVRLYVNGSVVASASPASLGISTQATYYNFSLYVYRHASTGTVTFYIGSAVALTYTGNTGTYNNAAYVGGELTTSAWGNDTFVDDFYIDYSTSQETNIAPPAYRYTLLRPTSDGTPTDWVCSTGTVNYQNVDDITPDSDTTYNSATAIDIVDEYGMTDFTLSVGLTVRSLIPIVYAKKTGAGTDPTVILGLDQGGVESYNSGHVVTTTYAYYWNQHLLDPNNASWTDSLVDSIKMQIKSGGTF